VKPKTKKFCLFQFISVFRTYIETTETNRTVSKQTKTTLNFLKNNKICAVSKCFSWSSVCFSSIETSKLSVLVQKRNNRNKPKQTETTLHFLKKYPNMLSIKLFVSVQSKHKNSLFRYRSKTTETNVLFWIVPKLVSVRVSVVSNRNKFRRTPYSGVTSILVNSPFRKRM
jgi:hypothetical protein